MYLANLAVLSMYSAGRVTGITCDSGHGQLHAVAVYEGFQVSHTCQIQNEISGRQITNHLVNLLGREGIDEIGRCDITIWKEKYVQEMKES